MRYSVIKVCGLRDAENIVQVEKAGATHIGFIFYKESKRFVPMINTRAGIIPDKPEPNLEGSVGRISPNASVERPKRPQRVGVFVDDMPQNIVTRVYNYDLDFVQLHGNEKPVAIENLRRSIVPDIRKDVKFIKAFRIGNAADLEQCKAYEGVADWFLFDTFGEAVGGTGKQFDWTVLEAYKGETPFLLSGGIGPDDVEALRNFEHPQCIGIDVNSRFETAVAVKDALAIERFIEALNA